MRVAILCSLAAAIAAGCGESTDTGAPASGPDADAPASAATVEIISMDLVARADAAHITRGGPLLDPGAPGWLRQSRLGDRGPWLAVREVEGRSASYPDGIGASLWFPVGSEGPTLESLELWMRPLDRDQRVSLFLDEQPMSTVEVRPGGRTYRLPLPAGGLSPGEHHLRFWFRHTRFLGHTRVPAAIDAVRLLPAGEAPELPDKWTDAVSVSGVDGPALLAGPPVRWTFYLSLPPGAVFRADAAVREGGPVAFTVEAQIDGAVLGAPARVEVVPGAVRSIEVPLNAGDASSAVLTRLVLSTSGDARTVAHAGWIRPRVESKSTLAAPLPPVRNIVVWTVDGWSAARVGIRRGGRHAETPNLDLLATAGAASADVWAGGALPADGHRQLLRPAEGGPQLAAVARKAGRATGLISASRAIDEAWTTGFDTRLDLAATGEPAETRVVLREMATWLGARRRVPFLLYLATADPLSDAPNGYVRRAPSDDDATSAEASLRERLALHDARLSAADYWLGQMNAVLRAQGLADDTAVIVVGTGGYDPMAGSAQEPRDLTPAALRVPCVIRHPRRPGVPGRAWGGALRDLPITVAHLLDAIPPTSWPGQPAGDLGRRLFSGGGAVTPDVVGAHRGNWIAARSGPWFLRGTKGANLGLWRADRDPGLTRDLAADNPIALRVLRDGLIARSSGDSSGQRSVDTAP